MDRIPLSEIKKQIAALETAERFFDSAVVFALHELGVFGALAGGPKTLPQLHAIAGGNEETLRAILDAGVALRILEKTGEAYAGREDLVECLGREESPAYLGEWAEFLHSVAAPLFRMGETVRTGRPIGTLFEDAEGGDDTASRRMTRAMDAYARSRGIEMASKLDFDGVATLLDIGCGPGTYSLAVLERNPAMRATLLDFPGPIEEARRIVAERGMGERVTLVAGDAFAWNPEHPFDAVLISNVLHMLGPERSRALIRRAGELIRPGGRLIVQAQYLADDRVTPRWATLLNLMMRVGSADGRNHAVGETAAWLEEAGLTEVTRVRFSAWNVNSCIVGRKPA